MMPKTDGTDAQKTDHDAVIEMCLRTVVDDRQIDRDVFRLSCGHTFRGVLFRFGARVPCGACVRRLFPHDLTGDWPAS